MGFLFTYYERAKMINKSINIAISGLGSITIDEIKKRIVNSAPKYVNMNWTTLNDCNLDCILINDSFFESKHIQKIITEKKIPFLKITIKSIDKNHNDPNLFSITLNDDTPINNLIQKCINFKYNLTQPILEKFEPEVPLKSYHFFNNLYSEYCHKLTLRDQNGIVAVIDHHTHAAWSYLLRKIPRSDPSISYSDAVTADLMQISRKHQVNLENWIFELIYSSNYLLELPEESAYFKIKYWPQPLFSETKSILQLSASFILGAQISNVSEKLGIPLHIVQKYVAANQAIQNIECISAKDAKFGTDLNAAVDTQEQSATLSFFQKIKRKFGF